MAEFVCNNMRVIFIGIVVSATQNIHSAHGLAVAGAGDKKRAADLPQREIACG